MKKMLMLGAAAIAAVGFVYTQQLIFYAVGLDENLFFNQKIFYYHVPNAFMLFFAVITAGVASAAYLKKRNPEWDDVGLAAGELAVLFGALMLITGSIWAKPAWGKWWEWDARLTTSLLLWLTMVGYLLLRRYAGPGSERLAAGLAVFAMVNVPLVYFSVRIWRTLHPKTSVVPTLTGGMQTAFWLSVLTFFIFTVLLLRVRIDMVRASRRLRETREVGLDAGLFS